MSNLRYVIALFFAVLVIGCNNNLTAIKKKCVVVNQLPAIRPDYTGITLPPSIAPLNFALLDSGTASIAEISSVNGAPIIVRGKKGFFYFNSAKWRKLLSKNGGNRLTITVYQRKRSGFWQCFTSINNSIAADSIDRYCTYRLLSYQYNYSRDILECQRDLFSFREKTLVNTQNTQLECVNCHIPCNNNPDRFVLQSRSTAYGSQTLIAHGDSITTLSSRLGHTAWHPDGSYIAFSVYKVEQYFHAVGKQFIDAYDNNSGIVLYDVPGQKTVPVPQLSQPGVLSTWPAWSPDGRYLYFSSAPVLWDDYHKEPPDNFNTTKYSLLRIAFDADRKSWGPVDTILSAHETGFSCTQPNVSPDGRFILFCGHINGAYPHTDASSDLYLIDIATRHYNKLPINSDYHESWHSWSQNGRWILFSSKRDGGIFTRLYICYIDATGSARKPFILPQHDPAFYDSFIKCYNVAEFATAPVQFSERQILKAIRTRKTISVPVQLNIPQYSADTLVNKWRSGSGRE